MPSSWPSSRFSGFAAARCFRLAIEEIPRAAFGFGFLRHRRLILAAAGAAAQMVERHVGHDSVEPSVEAALEPETVQISIDAQKALLVNVAGVFGAMNQIQRQPQDVAIVAPDQVVKRQAVSGLSLTDKRLLVRELHRSCLSRISF